MFEEKIVIDPDSFLKTNLKMSDFAEAVTYLPLSSEFLFGGIVDVKVKNSLIFICTSPDGLLRVFDFKGRFIH